MTCAIHDVPREVDIVRVENAQGAFVILIEGPRKDISDEHLVAVSQVDHYRRSAGHSRIFTDLLSSGRIQVDKVIFVKRWFGSERFKRTTANHLASCLRDVESRPSEAIDIKMVEALGRKDLRIRLCIFPQNR